MEGDSSKKVSEGKSRFDEFEDQFDVNGVKIGFKLPGNDFLFEYDSEGGWTDEQGNYFNKDGVLVDEESDSRSYDSRDDSNGGNSDSEDEDQDILDEFENMLIEEERGKVKSSKDRPKKENPTIYKDGEVDYEKEADKYINQLVNKVEIREGVSPLVFIYFKMRSKFYEKITPEVQKKQTIDERNEKVKSLKQQAEDRKKQLIEKNPWLKGDFTLNYSGSSLDEGVYYRYWYGMVKVDPQDYKGVLAAINKSEEFAILRSKSFYALKSKFYLKKSMKEKIQQLQGQIKDVGSNAAVEIHLNNLPEDFPMSFLLDLVELCGGALEDIEDIDIVDEYSAEIVCRKDTALKVMSLQGYCHDDKQYIWLEVKNLERDVKLFKEDKQPQKLFNIEIDSQYKIPFCELFDTLALLNGFAQVAKMYDKDDKEFRLAINEKVLSRVLMFRGETLNVVRVVRFEKVEDSKK